MSLEEKGKLNETDKELKLISQVDGWYGLRTKIDLSIDDNYIII